MRYSTLIIAALSLSLLSACGKSGEEKKSSPNPTLITVTPVSSGVFEVVEETLGTLEVLSDPKLSAEVPGRVSQVLARSGQAVKAGQVLAVIDPGDLKLQHRVDKAEVLRQETLLSQQDKLLERQQNLVAKGFLSKNAFDDVSAQRAALTAQVDASRARADVSARNLDKAQIRAPLDAIVETQMIAAGDYVKIGDPMFQLLAPSRLRAHLPFPESAAPRLKKGQVVHLRSPAAPGKVYSSRIHDIRPGIAEGSRSLDVLADIDNDGTLRGGGTVNATVALSSQAEALTVPEQSVVLRPAGKVVYVIVDENGQKKARQQIIKAGAKRHGRIEILEGLTGSETLALDGAGFLTHNAIVAIKDATKTDSPAKVGSGETAPSTATPGKPAAPEKK